MAYGAKKFLFFPLLSNELIGRKVNEGLMR
jgi:hypothetical protein